MHTHIQSNLQVSLELCGTYGTLYFPGKVSELYETLHVGTTEQLWQKRLQLQLLSVYRLCNASNTCHAVNLLIVRCCNLAIHCM